MQPTPSSLEVVMQKALDILRDYANTHGEAEGESRITSIQPAKVLTRHGMSHTDAERAYTALKRVDLVIVLKRGRGSIQPIVKIDMQTSVVERRLQRVSSHHRGHMVTTDQALLDYYTCQESELQTRLMMVQKEKAKIQARMSDNQSYQPT